ncbi:MULTISPECIES: hypothetical protein [unclassified Streptomyces]|uniref:hypothetical protein n=1 Tax=unclassified Streptomyces TaxID=2593676 RepID=UPI00093F0C26|nr:hypothetical protein [Streptomyces sp. CB02400]OKK07406.1 hypothetical protein AMK33_21065 [Streptomyces sp. CB02400]
MDNTTIFGARRAYEAGSAESSGVDLRSLMDVLEAVVLLEGFTVDNSSREEEVDWPELYDVSRVNGDFFQETALVAESGELHAGLLRDSAAHVLRLVRSGQLLDDLGFITASDDIRTLPPLYRDSAQFVDLTTEGVDRPYEQAVARQLWDLTRVLDESGPVVRGLAHFAFRGFYYQGMASSAGVPYMPHTWRSTLIRNHLAPRRARFADLVRDKVGLVRDGMRERVNGEFGGGAAISADFPLIASYVVGQCDSRATLLRTAVEVRRSAKATALRTWIHGIESKLGNQEDLVAIRAAQDELNALVHETERELGLTREEKQQVTLTLGVPMLSAETTTALPLHTRRPRLLRPRRPHLVFLRELARESARLAPFDVAFQRLG